MNTLKNPFAMRDGHVVMIEDISKDERGLACNCTCPNCGGEFIARFCKKKANHFAHSKDPCDAVLAYIAGMYSFITQELRSGKLFYVPALIVHYFIPHYGEVTEQNLEQYCKIITQSHDSRNEIVVSQGKTIIFDNVEIIKTKKGIMEAIELTYSNSKMAIKVRPPDTICKTGSVKQHKNMATLVLDLSKEEKAIQASTSINFSNLLLSKSFIKRWVYNPKMREAFPAIIAQHEEECEKHREYQKRIAEQQEKERAEREQRAKAIELEQQAKAKEMAEQAKQCLQTPEDRQAELQRQLKDGYNQVIDKFNQQSEQIRDSYGNRWVECEICGEVKLSSEFSVYGGQNSMNTGQCSKCIRESTSKPKKKD